MVKVSVVIPIYNVEDYLEECLDSIVNQTLEDMEIICINDGSTDNSLNILEKYSNIDNRIRVFNQENKGVSVSRNRGMKFCNGDYIYFMDSDDIIELYALEEAYNFSKSHDLDILFLKLINFYHETGEQVKLKYFEMPFLKPFNRKIFDFTDLGGNALKLCVAPPGILFKNNLIQSLQFKEGYIFEDNLFLAEAMLKAKRVSFLDEYLYNRRIRKNSITTSKTIKQADTIVIVNDIIDLFKKENIYEDYKKQIIEVKIRSAYKRFQQVDMEYKEEFFQRIKEDFSNFREDFENDDVFKHDINDIYRYYFRESFSSDNSREYELKCELYRNQSKIKSLKSKQKNLMEKNERLQEENNDLIEKIKVEKKTYEEFSNSMIWKLAKFYRKFR